MLVDAYRAGATVYQLATQFGIHRQTVSRILKRSGVTMRRRTLTVDEVDDLVRAHRTGDSLEVIAERFGIQPSTVLKRLNEHAAATPVVGSPAAKRRDQAPPI